MQVAESLAKLALVVEDPVKKAIEMNEFMLQEQERSVFHQFIGQYLNKEDRRITI